MVTTHELNTMLRSHCAVLGDSPAGVITAAVWQDLCFRMPFDSIAVKLDTNGVVAELLKELKGVVEQTLGDLSVEHANQEGGLDKDSLEVALTGHKRKKVRPSTTPQTTKAVKQELI